MSDKELLELAAKAAGMVGWTYHDEDGGALRSEPRTARYGPVYAFWSPLHDDGDALRLAVKLRMSLDYREDGSVNAEIYQPERMNTIAWEECGDDPYAATRRAIVRAAALSISPSEGAKRE